MSASASDSVIAQSAALLESRGLHALLGHLNHRTRHRYTGVYAFDPPMLRSLCLYDRENPGIVRGGDTPMSETYCSIVGEAAEWYGTADAAHDARLSTHPARASVIAYCGVPLVDSTGRCFGSLCHFDVRPRLIPTQEVPILYHVALMVAPHALELFEPASERQRQSRTPVGKSVQVGAYNEADQRQR